jgi:hypothetical protein
MANEKRSSLAYGDYRPFIEGGILSRLKYWNPFRRDAKAEIINSIKKALERQTRETLIACYLKPAENLRWTGKVQGSCNRYDISVFNFHEDCLFAEHHHAFIKKHFGGPFVTLPALFSDGTILFTLSMPKMRRVTRDDSIEEKILHLNGNFLREAKTFKTPSEILPIDFYALSYGTPYHDRIKSAVEALRISERKIPLVPIHGDFKPENLYVSAGEKIILTNYARSGWHVPYYDLFHYAGHRRPWFVDGMRDYFKLYLLDQVHAALGRKDNKAIERILKIYESP